MSSNFRVARRRLLPAPTLPRQAAPAAEPQDVRELLSFRLALLVTVNDRSAQAELQARFGLTLGEWRALSLIKALEPVSPGEIAAQLMQDVAQASRSIAALERRGLVARAASREDGRRALLRASPAGRRLHAQVMRYAMPANRDVLKDLAPAERRQFWNLLERVLDSVRAENARLRGEPAREEKAA